MKQSVILVVACAVVLGGAWFASRALSEVPEVTASPPTNAAPPPTTPHFAARPLEQPTARPLDKAAAIDAVIKARQEHSLTPVANAPPPAEPPADVAESPWLGVSRELDYADSLLYEQDAGIERLISARDVYRRCVEDMPELQRCKDNLAIAEERLAPPKKTALEATKKPTILPDLKRTGEPLPRAK